jgi:hypothetical protein
MGTATAGVNRIPQTAARRLRKELGLAVRNQDSIANGRRQWYWLREWVTIGEPARLP